MNSWATRLLWIIYIALLLVLLPHTAWAFAQFEPEKWLWLGWVAAVAFEGAIAALTWRMKQRFEDTPRYTAGWVWGRRFSYHYLHVYSLGLLVAIGISAAANWAHAVEFGQTFEVFGRYGIHPNIYAVAFGAILPLCSLMFARILADVRLTEQEADPALDQAKATIKELRVEVREAEQRARLAEQRFEAIGDLAIILTGGDKRQRIIATRQQWPALKPAGVAVIADASPSYVSEVLTEANGS
jgi:hypothetical protein